MKWVFILIVLYLAEIIIVGIISLLLPNYISIWFCALTLFIGFIIPNINEIIADKICRIYE